MHTFLEIKMVLAVYGEEASNWMLGELSCNGVIPPGLVACYVNGRYLTEK